MWPLENMDSARCLGATYSAQPHGTKLQTRDFVVVLFERVLKYKASQSAEASAACAESVFLVTMAIDRGESERESIEAPLLGKFGVACRDDSR